jgi:uncharacterized protein YbbC (DUF1343 family)
LHNFGGGMRASKLHIFKLILPIVLVMLVIACHTLKPGERKDPRTKKERRASRHKKAIQADTLSLNPQCSAPEDLTKIAVPGAYNLKAYLHLLKGKKVGLVVNQTSMIGNTHLVDTLLKLGIKIETIFAPEHGFRGDHSAGEHIQNDTDSRTGIAITSLYGTNKKPSDTIINTLDIVVFDIQDVGVRFYTYISTMHYVMEACAENDVPFLVLDRPNPNGHYTAGPVLDTCFRSFVGMHPIPLVHGMTVGELAHMINGEGWLKDSIKCSIKVIRCKNYTHHSFYKLPVRPSPNLPTMASVYLYPSLGLFEGTNVSVGRGTDLPFEILGRPGEETLNYIFMPREIPGVADDPKFKDSVCRGVQFTSLADSMLTHPMIDLYWLRYFQFTNKSEIHGAYFNKMFNKLAGTDLLQMQLQIHVPDVEIYQSWEAGLQAFAEKRKPYLLYP